MKCYKCKSGMEYRRDIHFNGHTLDGWKCKSCGESYLNPEKAEKILLINKLEKQALRAKLGKIRSNLILRVPKDIENALELRNGEEVILQLEKNSLKVTPARTDQ